VGAMPDVSYYGPDEMGDSERKDFLAWYEGQKSSSAIFDNRHILEQYCQDDVTVLRQACQAFRREFKEIGNIYVFLESTTIASACNKVFIPRRYYSSFSDRNIEEINSGKVSLGLIYKGTSDKTKPYILAIEEQ
jgi:hypothetical protein